MILSKYIYSYNRLFYLCVLLLIPLFIHANVSVLTTSGLSNAIKSDDVYVWKNIPYAKPPIGDLRWKAPQEIPPTNKVLSGKGSGCIQEPSSYAGLEGEGVVGSEDCLYLDIYQPAKNSNDKLPVMFWIHGGGNTTGTKDYYNFSKLSASKGIVVVVINYRLGPLGWFRHPAIQSLQDGIDKSSNFGTLDIIMALKWVQKNIHNFDGDKNNVTIFGESAGGHNVMTMLATPLSNGLFHKAISQSGYTTSYTAEQALGLSINNSVINDFGSLNVFSNASVSKITDSVIKNFNELDLQSQRRFLKNLKAEDFLSIYLELEKETFDYIPLVNRDGIVIPDEGILSALGNKKYAKNVPVIFGSNKDELSLWLGVNNYFSERTYPFTRLIPIPKIELKNPELYRLWLSVRSEAWKLRGVDEPLLQLEKAGYKNIYAYRFDWDDQKKSFFADFPNMIGAAHGLEIAFLTTEYKFGPVSSYVYPKTDERDQMEETFLSAWSNFAKKGEPIIENAKVQWEKYTSSKQAFMVLDNLSQLRSISDKKNMDDILSFAKTNVATDLEKCLLVRETVINIGDPNVSLLKNWNNGSCNRFDLEFELRKIEDDLISKYGQVSVF
jgi:para-nitrobenzyl esterase